MKKLFLVIVTIVVMVLLTSVSALGLDFSGKIGCSPNNNLKMNLNGLDYYFNYETGFLIGGEITNQLSEQLALGGGMEYSTTSFSGIKEPLEFIPLYGLVRYYFPINEQFEFFGNGKIGYAVPLANELTKESFDVNGGLFYGLGVGVVYLELFFVEIAYSISNGKLTDKITKITENANLKGFSFAIGINIDL